MFFSSTLTSRVAVVAMLAGFVLILRYLLRRQSPIAETHLRGRTLRPAREAVSTLAGQVADNGSGLHLGRMEFPARLAHGHFAFIGATGSGKTLLQRLLMQSVLPTIGLGRDRRALIYDAKQDLLSILAGMKVSCPVRIFHPLDSRGDAWAMALDVTSPSSALQVAALLVPKSDRDTNPFFTNAARHLLFGVLVNFILKAPGAWTFRHVLLVLRDAQLLRLVLNQSEETRHLLQYFQHEGTFQNIVSTILTVVGPYEIIAAAWDRAPTRVSLRDWLRDESILVLGNDEANRVAIDTMNRLVFQRLTELILSQTEVCPETGRQTWLFLDEVREMGRLDSLSRLLTKGRSKGAAVSLGFQDINGLHSVYGREVAEEILGQCNSKAVLRLNSPGTAAWASKSFGTREVLESARSESRSRSFRTIGLNTGGTSGESVSNGIAKRDTVLDSEFLDLPEPTPATGLHAYFLTPITGGFRDHLPGDWVRTHLVPPDKHVADSIPRPESEQYLRPWSEDDAGILGLPTASTAAPLRSLGGRR